MLEDTLAEDLYLSWTWRLQIAQQVPSSAARGCFVLSEHLVLCWTSPLKCHAHSERLHNQLPATMYLMSRELEEYCYGSHAGGICARLSAQQQRHGERVDNGVGVSLRAHCKGMSPSSLIFLMCNMSARAPLQLQLLLAVQMCGSRCTRLHQCTRRSVLPTLLYTLLCCRPPQLRCHSARAGACLSMLLIL